MSKLNGKVAVVTGATGGSGCAVAKRLGQDGYPVVLNGIQDETGAQRVEGLAAEGITAEYCGFDVTKEDEVTENITKIGKKYGRIDVLVNNAGGPGAGIYGTSKAGVHAITRALAKDLAEYGIRVNAVSPGTIDTPFHKQIKTTKPEDFASWAKNFMLGRLGQREDVDGVVSFLASKDVSCIIAETIQIGGGQALGI